MLVKKINKEWKIRRPKGVATIFFVIVFGLLLGFFMLVANTGLLIYQKMRLQTAVDLGAYAAASVQASYLGNEQSGDQSLMAINGKIFSRYGELLNDLQFGWVAPWPVGFPDPASCMAMCVAANVANGQYAAGIYKKAARDMEQYRQEAAAILSQLPEAAQKAAEETIRLNIPELSVEGDDPISSSFNLAKTVNRIDEVINSNKSTQSGRDDLSEGGSKKKNAVLTFQSSKGMYLANVVAAVPHSFAYYGPACYNKNPLSGTPFWFCMVNGAGSHGDVGFGMASLAFARSKAPAVAAGNIGMLKTIGDKGSNAIRTIFVPNTHKPEPFVTVSAEWYPASGRFANFENALGAKGSLFPKATKIIAIAAAEPFGGNLASMRRSIFGTRLQSIRKVLLDPRMTAVEEDFPGLYDYFETLSPVDSSGQPLEKSREIIKRFLH